MCYALYLLTRAVLIHYVPVVCLDYMHIFCVAVDVSFCLIAEHQTYATVTLMLSLFVFSLM